VRSLNSFSTRFARRPVEVRAFTLFELLLVIVLLSILAAVVWSGLGGHEQAQLNSMAGQVSAMLSYARSAAMNTGRIHRCVFADGGSRMWIESQADPVERPSEFEKVKADWAQLNLIRQGVHCSMVDLPGFHLYLRQREREVLNQEVPEAFYEPIEFYPDGRCNPCLIVLDGSEKDQVGLELNELTGQVKIVEKWPGQEQAK